MRKLVVWVMSCGCSLALVLIGVSRGPLAAEPKAPEKFVAVDTSRLMGLPESHPLLGVEEAFPNWKFTRPVDLTHAGDGSNRIFVVEQGGRIHVGPNDPNSKTTEVFLDLTDVVRRKHNEEGLLGLAFHPKYRENGEFFVFYSVTPLGTVISRFHVAKDNPNRADRASEEKLLEYRKPYGNHNGGCLKFGPDGFLYISIGDGGLANDPHGNGQNLETLLATILRIDVDQQDEGKHYSIPKDNPFVEQSPNSRGEIWAYGLRNPWRMSFDRQTGALWVGDVGQDHFEEVNVIVKGGNYGWNLREGKHPRDPAADRDSVQTFVEPVIDYPRVSGKSITGGLVYRGQRLPTIVGAYIYADFMSGNIWAVQTDGKKATADYKLARTSLMITAFGEDEAGELYFTAADGRVRQFRVPDSDEKHDFPKTLSETGLFSSVKDHEPSPGMIPYDVNVPLWSDGAVKDRFIALPQNGSVTFEEQEKWGFPVGTVIVKTFSLQTDSSKPEKTQRLETRLWLHSPRGWEGYTYMWNEDQSDANLLADWPFKKEIEITTPKGSTKQEWYFPSRSDCQACHTHNVGFVLGWNTRQLNKPATAAHSDENQIDLFQRLGLFTKPVTTPASKLEAYPEWEDDKAPPEQRARAYLDTNCAFCHTPGGFGTAGGARAELDYHNPFEKAFAIGTKSKPGSKPFIEPGQPKDSAIIEHMSTRNPKEQMPPLATLRRDDFAIDVISRWIKELPKPETK